MIRRIVLCAAIAAAIALPAGAAAIADFKFAHILEAGTTSTRWRIEEAVGGKEIRLLLPIRNAESFRFDCAPGERLKVTTTAVVGLKHFANDTPYPEGATAPVPSDGVTLVLAVSGVKQTPTPAVAARNPAGGWDLTMDIAKADPAFVALPTADLMSVIANADTTAVMLGPPDRTVIGDFVKRCRAL